MTGMDDCRLAEERARRLIGEARRLADEEGGSLSGWLFILSGHLMGDSEGNLYLEYCDYDYTECCRCTIHADTLEVKCTHVEMQH